MTDEIYRRWLAARRELSPPETLADQIMSEVAVYESRRQLSLGKTLLQRVERSRVGRIAVCGGALAIGGLPFLFLAYVAQFVTF